jgi:hypothetical protein
MYETRHISEKGEQDIEPEMQSKSHLKKDTYGRDNDGCNNSQKISGSFFHFFLLSVMRGAQVGLVSVPSGDHRLKFNVLTDVTPPPSCRQKPVSATN